MTLFLFLKRTKSMAIVLGCFVLVCETRLKLDKSLCRAPNAEVEWSRTLLARKVSSHPRHGTSHRHQFPRPPEVKGSFMYMLCWLFPGINDLCQLYETPGLLYLLGLCVCVCSRKSSLKVDFPHRLPLP